MGLFRNDPQRIQLESPVRLESRVTVDAPVEIASHDVELKATHAPWSLWADAFGKLGIRAIQIIVVVAVAAGVIYAIRQLTIVTIPMVIALILACAFNPVMNWMRRRGIPSVLATVLTLLGIVAILGALGSLIVWAVRDQWRELYTQAEEGFQHLLAWSQTLPFEFLKPEQVDKLIATVTEFVTSAQFGSGAIAGVSAVASFLTGLVLMVVTLFFFLKDGAHMWEFILRPFRGESYQRARRIGDRVVGTLGSYVRGTATVAAVDAIGILIGLLIFRVPLAIPLAVLVFLLAFIPIVGATIAGILAALVALVTNGWINALAVVGIVVLVNQLEGNFLQPVLMGRSLKLHAFVILIALTIGTVLGGIVGAVLAVPITATLWGIIKVWDGPDTPAWWARPKDSLTS